MPVILKFDEIHQHAEIGFRRAAVFLGLGVNAANRPDFNEYQLGKESYFRILPEEVPQEAIDEWKKHFNVWISAGVFREIVENSCLLLDRIFHCISQIPVSESHGKLNFEKLGLDKKLQILSTRYGITTSFDDSLGTFYPVRNCLVHRMGMVGKIDVARGPLRYKCHAHQIFLSTSSGEIEFPDIPKDALPIYPPDGGDIKLRVWALMEKSFNLGDAIHLSPDDLQKAIIFSRQCAINVLRSAADYCISKGVIVLPLGETVKENDDEK